MNHQVEGPATMVRGWALVGDLVEIPTQNGIARSEAQEPSHRAIRANLSIVVIMALRNSRLAARPRP